MIFNAQIDFVRDAERIARKQRLRLNVPCTNCFGNQDMAR